MSHFAGALRDMPKEALISLLEVQEQCLHGRLSDIPKLLKKLEELIPFDAALVAPFSDIHEVIEHGAPIDQVRNFGFHPSYPKFYLAKQLHRHDPIFKQFARGETCISERYEMYEQPNHTLSSQLMRHALSEYFDHHNSLTAIAAPANKKQSNTFFSVHLGQQRAETSHRVAAAYFASHLHQIFQREQQKAIKEIDSPLTPRELEVLKRLHSGATNQVIADHLNCSERTVRFHLSNIYRKLSVGGKVEALAHALHRGLIEL